MSHAWHSATKKRNPKRDLGRQLMKNNTKKKNWTGSSDKHNTELDDGYDWAKSNVRSITEENHLDEFLNTAILAGAEFAAEKTNASIITGANECILRGEGTNKSNHVPFKLETDDVISIPRRPIWNESTTKEQLITMENEQFLIWRRKVAAISEANDFKVTPFERNLEFWRQLWRVVEKSDVVIQLVDARNPLLFYCTDLEKYVHEVSPNKRTAILLNKSDFLTEDQRKRWFHYFESINLNVIFYSALEQIDELDKEEEKRETRLTTGMEDSDSEGTITSDGVSDSEGNEAGDGDNEDDDDDSDNYEDVDTDDEEEDEVKGDAFLLKKKDPMVTKGGRKGWDIVSAPDLVDIFTNLYHSMKETQSEGLITIGLVGYPNVGKSSTINTLCRTKKVPTSATPGKTKHFQTILLSPEIMLCDCPGLVFPNFVSDKAHLILNGVLSIDQMTNHVLPINALCEQFNREYLEWFYGIRLSRNPDKVMDSEEFLTSYGMKKGFMTSRSLPNQPKTSRLVLKDYVSGKLLYCHCPPGDDQDTFHPLIVKEKPKEKILTPFESKILHSSNADGCSAQLDRAFFLQEYNSAHQRGSTVQGITGDVKGITLGSQLPPKGWKKHLKQGRKEKLRRVYSHMDQ